MDMNEKADSLTRKLYAIPLLPHYEHRRRRLLEQLQSTEGHPSTIQVVNSSIPRRPSNYQRRRTNQAYRHPVELFQGLGTHYTDLWCGTPPQRQTVIVDTGSSMTAFPCSQCRSADYHHIDDPFQQELSSTFREPTCSECSWGKCTDDPKSQKCTFSAVYQEGSNWTAVESIDRCYIGGMHTAPLTVRQERNHGAFDLRFGCQTEISGDFVTQLADGIMGMDIGASAVWNQMYDQHRIESRAFALCFQRRMESDRTGTESGAMTLGGADARLHTHTMVYSKTEPGAFYTVQLRRLYLRKGGGDSVLANKSEDTVIIPVSLPDELNEPGKRHVIVDSGACCSLPSTLLNMGNVPVGTTDSFFSYLLKDPFEKAWLEAVGKPYDNDPATLTEEQLQAFPTFLLQLVGWDDNVLIQSESSAPLASEIDPDHPNDILVAVPPSHYMEYQDDHGGYVAGFYWDEPEGIVIGANVMMKHDILFDIQNSRIGWAESNCNYSAITDGSQDKPSFYISATFDKPQEVMREFCSTFSCWPGMAVFVVLVAIVCCRILLLRRKRFKVEPYVPIRSVMKASSYAVRSAPIRREFSRRMARRTVSEVQGFSNLQPSTGCLGTVSESTQNVGATGHGRRTKRGGVLRSRSHQRDGEVCELIALLEEER